MGSVENRKAPSRLSTLIEDADGVRDTLMRNLSTKTRSTTFQLGIPKTTVRRKRLKLYPYKVQLLRELKPNGKPLNVQISPCVYS
ncbi:hypothetical protein NPIL_56161 [Nephila pilipes]|uniref:Uncharacterized protein n=1 Tax=Nephila pilipes TaxID=299642 RepID=A0A8X6NYY5_NEPPI|nr:hypothetical protein NPIL_56161 [Nephila pilipes]